MWFFVKRYLAVNYWSIQYRIVGEPQCPCVYLVMKQLVPPELFFRTSNNINYVVNTNTSLTNAVYK